MRRYIRQTCSEGWIINVSPEGMRPDVSTRLFQGVQQPLAIGIFTRRSDTDPTLPAALHYTEVHGKRQAKYDKLAALGLDDSCWQPIRTDWEAPFTPAISTEWDDYPALGDLFPWVAPGIKPNRTWVYSPSTSALADRWSKLIGESDLDKKKKLFKESTDRKIDTKISALPGYKDAKNTIAAESGPCPEPRRVAFRAFDRQWIIPDKRVIHRPSDDLWRAASVPGQIFLVEQHAHPIRTGPAVAFAALIPDIHYFNGRGGRVLPLFHPDSSVNIAPNLLSRLSERLGFEISGTDLIAYIASIAAHPAFTARFASELGTPGIRIPLTRNAELFNQASQIGREVVWAATFGLVFADAPQRPYGKVTFSQDDPRRVENLTSVGSSLPENMSYEADNQIIRVGSGTFGVVPERVWSYDVGGMITVKHWLDYRKANPGGKKTSELDSTFVSKWPIGWIAEFIEVLSALRRVTDLEPAQAKLLDDVLSGPLFSGPELENEGVAFPKLAKDRRPRLALSEGGAQGTLY